MTKVSDQITNQLNTSSSQGLTLFAPTDAAFSGLRPGMLNSFSDQQKVELVQFHVVPTEISTWQFQTASNPLRTQAGGSPGSFQLNVTTSSLGNSNNNTNDDQVRRVNITTGVTNATMDDTLYTDEQLAVYEVDRVLLPLTTPAPGPSRPNNNKAADAKSDDGGPGDSSSGIGPYGNVSPAVMACMSLVIALAEGVA